MANLHPTAWVAPGAYLRGDVTLGEQTNVWYNAVLRADQEKITIGAFSNVQDNCVLHGDAGIGMNSVILDHAVIGEGSIVGAGAVVAAGTIVPPRSLVVGIPAKVKKTLTDEDVAGSVANADSYLGLMTIGQADPENQG